jgi:hypothetical protein
LIYGSRRLLLLTRGRVFIIRSVGRAEEAKVCRVSSGG